MESCPDTKVVSEIRTVVDRSVSKVFQISAFPTVMKRAVRKYMGVSYVLNNMPTSTIDAAAFTVLVGRPVETVVEKFSCEKT